MPGPSSLSAAEVDLYSIRLCVQSGLAADGWTGAKSVPIKLAQNGWPKPEDITLPSVYVAFGPSDVAGVEMGSHGKARDVRLHIYGNSDPMATRLAEEIVNLFRDDQVSILQFTSGSEVSPPSVGRYEVDEAGWRPVPMPASATDVDKWRALVSVTLRRIDA